MPKFKTPTAILIFWDEKKNEPRKVLFGNPEELSMLWGTLAPVAHQQIMELNKKPINTLEDMTNAIENLTIRAEKINKSVSIEDAYLDLTYEIKEEAKN